VNDDFEIEEELRRAADLLDPVPGPALRAAIDAYALRTMDDELAALAFDSLSEPVVLRGGDQVRVLTFRTEEVTVDVEFASSSGTQRLLGQLIPPQAAEIEIRGATSRTVSADSLGRFACDDIPTGPFSMRCRIAGAGLVTEWITV
jgi:hypothetical protein